MSLVSNLELREEEGRVGCTESNFFSIVLLLEAQVLSVSKHEGVAIVIMPYRRWRNVSDSQTIVVDNQVSIEKTLDNFL